MRKARNIFEARCNCSSRLLLLNCACKYSNTSENCQNCARLCDSTSAAEFELVVRNRAQSQQITRMKCCYLQCCISGPDCRNPSRNRQIENKGNHENETQVNRVGILDAQPTSTKHCSISVCHSDIEGSKFFEGSTATRISRMSFSQKLSKMTHRSPCDPHIVAVRCSGAKRANWLFLGCSASGPLGFFVSLNFRRSAVDLFRDTRTSKFPLFSSAAFRALASKGLAFPLPRSHRAPLLLRSPTSLPFLPSALLRPASISPRGGCVLLQKSLGTDDFHLISRQATPR